jgi:hypothetical protein
LSSVEGDVHLPTYYWILKQILTLFNEPSELVLIMFHVIPFIIGLLFGIFVIQRIFKNFSLIYLVLTITITLPNFIFYATNLRMYSLLFMMEMIFIDAISRILSNKKATSNYQLLWLLLSGFALLFVDYSSIIYYVSGVLFLLIRSLVIKERKSLVTALISISPLIFLAIISIKSIKAIISWDIQASSGIQGMSFLELAKWLYLACRPVFDLIYPASLPTVIAIFLPLLILGLLLYSGIILFYKAPQRWQQNDWILLISMLWVPLALTGYGFTRLLLPSQFFIVAVMIWAIFCSRKPIKLIGLIIIGILLFINLTEVAKPTLRLYNIIPYSEIATDLVEFSQQQGVNQIFLSNNSLNTLSIHRYITKIDRTKELQIRRVDSTFLDNVSELKQQSFLFVSHLDENDQFVDIRKFLPSNLQNLKNYVLLENLP